MFQHFYFHPSLVLAAVAYGLRRRFETIPSRPIVFAAPPPSTCWLYWMIPSAGLTSSHRLAIDRRKRAQILAVPVQAVERDEREQFGVPRDARVDLMEVRPTVRPGRDHLAVKDERLGRLLLQRGDNRPVAPRPVVADLVKARPPAQSSTRWVRKPLYLISCSQASLIGATSTRIGSCGLMNPSPFTIASHASTLRPAAIK